MAGPVVAIVDDDASLREAIGSLLASFDIGSQKFCDAHALLASPMLADFSCFLSDVVMPGFNGFALAERLRALGHLQPMIFMTAHQGAHYAARAQALGACCLLTKPFTTDALMACMAQALEAGGSPQPTRP